MASTGAYRNGVTKGVVKLDRPLSVNSNSKSASSSFKSKHSPTASAIRPSNFSSPGGGSAKDAAGVSGRVRVAIRLRPQNAEELVADADFADCVELQPELKRLKVRRNNWDSDTYEFDEVFTEFASQKRIYEVVAKPIVESVLDGYNGTVMAYGQTGTGKTYTLGQLGDEDTADRGIMVRAMEDILAEISLETDSVCVSYLQLYMETIQDLLDPANDNILITEDPKRRDVSLQGATFVDIRDQKSFLELLRLGEAHRFAANTKLNTESSRSHAILMVHVKRSVKGKDYSLSSENRDSLSVLKTVMPAIVRKGKLVVVDLAGSERIDKSGSRAHTLEEAKSVNLSLSVLGKCINALAENNAHIPVRDSKLTRLLKDSFGGTARTSLVVTIGPSPRHRGETMSTIMFGQRAMKVENMLKIKEEFDYKSLSRRLDMQLDKLIAEHERQQKRFQDEIERLTIEAQKHISQSERNHADALEVPMVSYVEEVTELKRLLQDETLLRKSMEEEVNNLRNQLMHSKRAEAVATLEISKLQKLLEDEASETET
ncbi:Plus-end-directed kinesin ATPase [Bertholletia excelsa]